MAWYIKAELDWLAEHGRQDERGRWWCRRKPDQPISTADVGRSIHTGIFPGAGAGEVRTVTHLNCNACDPGKEPPSYGMPIVEHELVELD